MLDMCRITAKHYIIHNKSFREKQEKRFSSITTVIFERIDISSKRYYKLNLENSGKNILMQ